MNRVKVTLIAVVITASVSTCAHADDDFNKVIRKAWKEKNRNELETIIHFTIDHIYTHATKLSDADINNFPSLKKNLRPAPEKVMAYTDQCQFSYCQDKWLLDVKGFSYSPFEQIKKEYSARWCFDGTRMHEQESPLGNPWPKERVKPQANYVHLTYYLSNPIAAYFFSDNHAYIEQNLSLSKVEFQNVVKSNRIVGRIRSASTDSEYTIVLLPKLNFAIESLTETHQGKLSYRYRALYDDGLGDFGMLPRVWVQDFYSNGILETSRKGKIVLFQKGKSTCSADYSLKPIPGSVVDEGNQSFVIDRNGKNVLVQSSRVS